MASLGRIVSVWREEGPSVVFKKVVNKVRRSARSRKRRGEVRDILALEDAKSRFTRIYETNHWSEAESVSGPSSTFGRTKNVRENLARIIAELEIATLLDAPCGDFEWMQHVVRDAPDLSYQGADIVEPLIAANTQRYADDRTRFRVLDITKDDLPAAELMLVRDCLFHLCYTDIEAFKRNLMRSDVKWLLTSTHVADGGIQNADIVSGDFRQIDIFSTPFNFPAPPTDQFLDHESKFGCVHMCLFRVDDLRMAWSAEA